MDCVLVFANVFFLALFSDLETDNINPIDLCNRLNYFILPEAVVHSVMTVLFLFSGFWFEFIANVPLVVWHTYCFMSKKLHLEPTTIFSSLDNEKKHSYFKIAFYLVSFFFFLYRLIYTLVSDVVGTNEANLLLNKL